MAKLSGHARLLNLLSLMVTLVLVNFFAPAQAAASTPKLITVPYVEVARYLGVWHEVMRIPNSFQKGCTNTTATYHLNDDHTLRVLNRCTVTDPKTGETKLNEILGKAWIEDQQTNAKLKVSFVRIIDWIKIFGGKYWILELGPIGVDGLYSYAVVGEPSRKYGWILAREPQLAPEQLAGIMRRLHMQGYDPKRFIRSTP
jgi:apolipoprotein D and lipocalin family protein